MSHLLLLYDLKKTEVLLPVPVVELEKVSPNLWQRCSQSCCFFLQNGFTMIVFWMVVSNMFLFSPLLGEMIQFH